MAKYLDQYTLSQDVDFQHRIMIALISAASAIVAQVKPDSGQLAAAQRVMDEPAANAVAFALLIVLDPQISTKAPISADVSDDQITTAVQTYFKQLVR